ncbi:MAG TPA: hypothetical protein EYP74_01320 [Anaerolineales bacterium]|nr:hypothetical protein [Anaerolineales bacterium]
MDGTVNYAHGIPIFVYRLPVPANVT